MPTAGPTICGTGTQGTIISGLQAWANPSRITANDGSTSTVTVGSGSGATSNSLEATNFGFALSGAASIDGIQMDVKQFQGAHAGAGAYDFNVWLIIHSGSVVGTNKATLTSLDVFSTLRTYGGAADTWAAGLNGVNVSDSTFGVYFQVKNDDADATAQVDYIQATITYTTFTGLPARVMRFAREIHPAEIFE